MQLCGRVQIQVCALDCLARGSWRLVLRFRLERSSCCENFFEDGWRESWD